MNKQFYKDALGWGILLWLIGYILGIILFMVVSQSYDWLVYYADWHSYYTLGVI